MTRSHDRNFHRLTVTVPRAATEAFNIRYKTGYYSEPPQPRDGSRWTKLLTLFSDGWGFASKMPI